ncbi:hypothetical protein IG631_23583 [Alternaria alternata]|nr:hypothetical protein IG631_23583 [Alternaria alternata]
MSSIPVNFDNVRYSPVDRRPYFWDPAYPQWIQFLENGAWASRHVSRVKEYVFLQRVSLRAHWPNARQGDQGREHKEDREKSGKVATPKPKRDRDTWARSASNFAILPILPCEDFVRAPVSRACGQAQDAAETTASRIQLRLIGVRTKASLLSGSQGTNAA